MIKGADALPLEIRAAIREDLRGDELGRVASSVGTSLTELRNGLAVAGRHLWVVEPAGGGGPRGFFEAQIVADELEVLFIAVCEEHRGCGVGGFLLESGLVEAQRRGVTRAHLDVRPSNSPALRLYRRVGFAEVGRRVRYYRDGEDALLMTWSAPRQSGG